MQKSVAASTAASAAVATATASSIPKVTAHVVDTVTGRPATGMGVKLFSENQSGTWSHVVDW